MINESFMQAAQIRNRVSDLEGALAGSPTSGEVFQINNRARFGGGSSYSDWAFGFSLNPDGDNAAEVLINAGEIDRITVAAAKVVVANDEYVYIRRTISDNTMQIATAASVPADDATYRYYRLYQFAVTDGAASLKLAFRPFDIEGGTALTVSESDDTPTVDNVVKIAFDKDDFTVTDDTGGKVTVRSVLPSGFTGTVTCVGAIQYASDSLQYKLKTATYSNGVLTAAPTLDANWTTVFTAVTGCP
jgi:hypothetical protein